MPSNAVVRARIDEDIKDEASAVLASMGLTVSDALRDKGRVDPATAARSPARSEPAARWMRPGGRSTTGGPRTTTSAASSR